MKLQILAQGGEEVLAALEPGQLASGFHEGVVYWVAKPAIPATLYVDDAPLPEADHPGFWAWEPGFYAGEVFVELDPDDGSGALTYFLDVSPHQDKLGRDQYFQMIEEVASFDLRLIMGMEPSRAGLGGQSEDDAPWITYARMREGLANYIGALGRLAERPIRRLVSRRQSRRLHHVQVFDVTALRQLVTNPALVAVLGGQQGMQDDVVWQDDSLNVPFAEMTLDNPANRAMVAQLDEVLHRVDGVIQSFEFQPETGSETRTAVRPRLGRRLRWLKGMRRRLVRLLQAHPFDGVTQSAVTAAGLNAISADPVYARAHRLGAGLLQRGLSSLGEHMHYLSPTWQIYEAWCLVSLAKALTVREGVDWEILKVSGCQMALATQVGDREVRLYFQLRCPSLRESALGYSSISRERIPDMVIEVRQGEEVGFVCLDAKYRVSGQAVLDAMASAHIYHDAIRWQGRRPWAAFLVVPHAQSIPEMATETYRVSHGVGMIPLANSVDAEALWHLVLRS